MMCEPMWKASMFGSCFAFAHCLFSLLTPKLADKIGRKWVFKLTRIFDCVLLTVLITTESYAVAIAICIGLGAFTPCRLNVGIPYLNEWFPRKGQTLAQVGRLLE